MRRAFVASRPLSYGFAGGAFGKAVLRSCRVGESGGWRGKILLDRREVQMSFGHGELSGPGSAFGSCSSQGLEVRSPNTSQWCIVRVRRGEAQKY